MKRHLLIVAVFLLGSHWSQRHHPLLKTLCVHDLPNVKSVCPAFDNFGHCVSISGDVVMVGKHRDDDACSNDPDCNSGSAYVYRFDGIDWLQEQKLTASDAAARDVFGGSVSLSGDVTVIGAAFNDDACVGDLGCNSGSAYVYRFDGTNWIEETKLTASDAEAGEWFGKSVAMSADVVIIAAPRDDDGGIGAARCAADSVSPVQCLCFVRTGVAGPQLSSTVRPHYPR